jgi:hypothetical protein
MKRNIARESGKEKGEMTKYRGKAWDTGFPK